MRNLDNEPFACTRYTWECFKILLALLSKVSTLVLLPLLDSVSRIVKAPDHFIVFLASMGVLPIVRKHIVVGTRVRTNPCLLSLLGSREPLPCPEELGIEVLNVPFWVSIRIILIGLNEVEEPDAPLVILRLPDYVFTIATHGLLL